MGAHQAMSGDPGCGLEGVQGKCGVGGQFLGDREGGELPWPHTPSPTSRRMDERGSSPRGLIRPSPGWGCPPQWALLEGQTMSSLSQGEDGPGLEGEVR